MGTSAEGRREESLGGGDGSMARRREGRRRGDEDGAEELRAAAIGRRVRTPPDQDGIERWGLTRGSGGVVVVGLGFGAPSGYREWGCGAVGPVAERAGLLGRSPVGGGLSLFSLFFCLFSVFFYYFFLSLF